MLQTDFLYDERFLESYAGAIITDPATAIVELVANCWDAYATEVRIQWPDVEHERVFSIADNGHGMTKDEFLLIWRTIAYNRITAMGDISQPPPGLEGAPRTVFGKNGKGRFASFCFSDEYLVTSVKNGEEFSCVVKRTDASPMSIENIEVKKAASPKSHGTYIRAANISRNIRFTREAAREVLGSRFLANPSFKVSIDDSEINFNDIPNLLSTEELHLKGLGVVRILHIDTRRTDKTTKQHGIAWWVQNRAVGPCKWAGSDYERILDGRTSEAKRWTFIVQADFLNAKGAVQSDWSGFVPTSDAWIATQRAVQNRIREIIVESGEASRTEMKSNVLEKIGASVNTLSYMSKERVQNFVEDVVEKLPGFGELEIVQLASLLANLEKSKTKYGLLELLHDQAPDDLDSLHGILGQWTIGMAKIVLDEIQGRLKTINELSVKIQVANINEVKELQALFANGLWMFGDIFESIHFTSNKGMTTVIRELFEGKAKKATLNRPDFVILPKGVTGLYSLPSYNFENQEEGCAHLVIVDLKTTGLPLGSTEKQQIWKYVKELKSRGYIKPSTRVDGFILGDKIEEGEGNAMTEDNGRVTIQPMLYSIILKRAEQRLLKLYERVKEAPFLLEQEQNELSKFIEPISIKQATVV